MMLSTSADMCRASFDQQKDPRAGWHEQFAGRSDLCGFPPEGNLIEVPAALKLQFRRSRLAIVHGDYARLDPLRRGGRTLTPEKRQLDHDRQEW
jgi:hypothetical protein